MEICGFVLSDTAKMEQLFFKSDFTFTGICFSCSSALLHSPALLRASALSYHTRSLARTCCCYLTVCVTAVTLRFALLLLPYGLRYCCYLTVCVTAVTLRFAFATATFPFMFCCRCLPVCIAAAVAREPHHFSKYFKTEPRFSKIK